MRRHRRVRRLRDGTYAIDLPRAEQDLIEALPQQLNSSLEGADEQTPPELRRLFPPTYLHQAQAEHELDTSWRSDLLDHHRQALTTLTRTARLTKLDEDQAQSWLAAVNDLRLTIGTALEITEEGLEIEQGDDRYERWVCYQYLSFLQSELIDALDEGLPEVSSDDDELIEDPWGDPPGGLRWDGTTQPGRP